MQDSGRDCCGSSSDGGTLHSAWSVRQGVESSRANPALDNGDCCWAGKGEVMGGWMDGWMGVLDTNGNLFVGKSRFREDVGWKHHS